MAGFVVTIQQFEGPLDLMLHLIRENKLDLFDLDIAELADQYIAFIKAMEKMDLLVASEYLVELANLIEYKSRKLLPRENPEFGPDDYQESDPDLLVRRLLEYQRYKEVSLKLQERAQQRERMLEKPASSLIDQWVNDAGRVIEPLAVYQLFNAMERCQRRFAIAEPLQIQTAQREMTLQERIAQVKDLISGLPVVFSFEDLCADARATVTVIMTFLAILEMLKDQLLTYQVKADTIYFRRGVAYGG